MKLLLKKSHQFTHHNINVVPETPNFLPRPTEGMTAVTDV